MAHALMAKGLKQVKIRGDGHCLYRAIGYCVHKTHEDTRQEIVRQTNKYWDVVRPGENLPGEKEAFLRETQHEIWGGAMQAAMAGHIWKLKVIIHHETETGVQQYSVGPENGTVVNLIYTAQTAKDAGAHYDVAVEDQRTQQGEYPYRPAKKKHRHSTDTAGNENWNRQKDESKIGKDIGAKQTPGKAGGDTQEGRKTIEDKWDKRDTGVEGQDPRQEVHYERIYKIKHIRRATGEATEEVHGQDEEGTIKEDASSDEPKSCKKETDSRGRRRRGLS